MDISENSPKGDLGLLKYGVVGKWKVLPAAAQTLTEVVDWAKSAWRLKGCIAIYPLNQNLFFMGFELPEEAIWVMENGNRICRGGVMQLEWWSPSSGCKGIRDQETEAWIRVVGLPLHLWTGEILKKVGDSCGGFVAMDEGTTSKTELLWARILVKMSSNAKHDSVNLIEGDRSYEVQIWWEIRLTVAEEGRKSSRSTGGTADIGEEDDRDARAKGHLSPARVANCHTSRNELREVGNRPVMGNCSAAGRLEIGQMRGVKLKVGDKKKFEGQNALGIRGRKGKPINSHKMDLLKERVGLHLEGAGAKGVGQIQGALVGPSPASPGEKSERPNGRIYHTACKEKREEKNGLESPSCEEASECEMSAGENRSSHVTNSSQDQASSKGNNKKQVTNRKESYLIKDIVGSEEEDEVRYYGEPEQESFSGKFLEKTPSVVDMEDVGAELGSLCVAVESPGFDLKDATQAEGKIRCSSRNLELITGDLRLEVAGEDDTRAGKGGSLGEAGLGNCDGTRSESSGRERHTHREGQVEMQPVSGQSLRAGRVSGTEWGSDREMGRPNVSTPIVGMVFRVALCPVSSIRVLLNGTSLYEPTCSKAKAAVSEPGLCQDLISKSGVNSDRSGPIFSSLEEGQEENALNHGEGDDLREVAVQEDGYTPMYRYDDNRYVQYSPIPMSVFGRPLLPRGFSGQGVSDKALVPLRATAADDMDWGSPSEIFDVGEENGEVGHRKMQFQLELLENWKYESWESRCLVKFSEFLGFTTMGFEKKILNLLGKLVASQRMCKAKGSPSVSKSERELRRLRSTINYNGNKINKGGGRDRGNLLLKLK